MKDATEQMEKTPQGLVAACEEASATYRQSMGAVLESTSAFTKGCEEFGRNFGELMQESMTRAISAGKTMLSAKTAKEFADLQNDFVKGFFDQWVAGTGRLSEISARTTQEAFEPVAKHANAALSKAAQQTRQGRAA